MKKVFIVTYVLIIVILVAAIHLRYSIVFKQPGVVGWIIDDGENKFDKVFKDSERAQVIERANEADRAVYRLKKRAFKDHEDGKPENEILEEMAAQRIRCPLLDTDDRCALYADRPLTCRLYGIPTVIGGQAHTCGLSGFEPGKAYPTVKLDAIQQKLYDLSAELARDIGSRYPKLAELLVPVSMALLTEYTEEYLGVKVEARSDDKGEV